MTITPSRSGSIFGHSVKRTEDKGLITGAESYTGDLPIEGSLHVVFVRSPMAHGTLNSVDVEEARTKPGVVGVYVDGDLQIADRPGLPGVVPDAMSRPPLARGRVRFVGDIIAAVVAETSGQALDAAESVLPDIDPLPAVVGIEEAMAEGAPVIFEEHGSNVVAGAGTGEVEGIFDTADTVVSGKFYNQRLAGVPMEPNAAVAVPGEPNGGVTLWLSIQTPHGARDALAGDLGLEADQVRVIAPRVGGGFGPKATAYPEYSIAARAAMDLGRPVRWTETRSENMLSMVHGRAQVQHVELGVKNDGRIVGLRASVVGDGGMYPAVGTILPSLTQLMAQGVYDIPAIEFAWKTVVTNTTTTGAYRGAGRPEATQLLERIIDMAADEIGMDPLEMRRKNFLQPDKFPMTSLTGARVRQRRAREGARRGQGRCRLRRSARRAGAPPRRGQPLRHGHRCRLVRRGHRPARARRRVRLGAGAPRRHVHGHGRDERPRPGPRDRLRPARRGCPRRADGEDQGRPVRHRAGAQRRRHAGVALAADRRQRHPQRVRAAGVAGQGDRRAPARGRGGGHRADRRRLRREGHRRPRDHLGAGGDGVGGRVGQ